MFRMIVDADLKLVFLEESLAPVLFDLIDANRDYLGEWFPWVEDTRAVSDIQAFTKRSVTGFANGRELVCAIEYQDSIVGIISYNRIRADLKKVEIGYWLAESAQGQGVMSRSCKCLMLHAFENMGMEKVEVHVATKNRPSRELCERLGMTLEGVVGNAEKLSTGIVDHAIYGLYKPGKEARR